MFTYVYIYNNLCLTYEIYFNLLNFLFKFNHTCKIKNMYSKTIYQKIIFYLKK